MSIATILQEIVRQDILQRTAKRNADGQCEYFCGKSVEKRSDGRLPDGQRESALIRIHVFVLVHVYAHRGFLQRGDSYNEAITSSRNISRQIMQPLCRVPATYRDIDISIQSIWNSRRNTVEIETAAGRTPGVFFYKDLLSKYRVLPSSFINDCGEINNEYFSISLFNFYGYLKIPAMDF